MLSFFFLFSFTKWLFFSSILHLFCPLYFLPILLLFFRYIPYLVLLFISSLYFFFFSFFFFEFFFIYILLLLSYSFLPFFLPFFMNNFDFSSCPFLLSFFFPGELIHADEQSAYIIYRYRSHYCSSNIINTAVSVCVSSSPFSIAFWDNRFRFCFSFFFP